MEKVTVTINGMEFRASKGDTILHTALAHGIYIPHLCYHPDLEPFGGCRLCIVDIKGKGIIISCKALVEEGMAVLTETPEINRIRRVAAELLIANHQGDCLSCSKNTQCKLQDVANYIGITEDRVRRLKRFAKPLPIDQSNPFFDRDPNKCILCGICVRTCEQAQEVGAIDFVFRGMATKVSTLLDKPIRESRCESCGQCVVNCPVGSLVPKKMQKPSHEVKSVCPYCGCGCGIYLGVRGQRIVGIRSDPDSPVNEGNLCVKGRYGYDFINHSDRLTTPLIKRNGEFVKATWDEALGLVSSKLQQYRGDQFAFIASAKCTNEENYLFQKFTRSVMGTNNIDHCARLCHAPSLLGLLGVIGSGAMTNPIAEIEQAKCILAIGTNTTETHPVVGLRVKKAVKKGAALIVANPKRIELCRFADVFLQIRPGTDVALIMGMCRVIVDENLLDAGFIGERCEGFQEFKKSLELFDLDFVQKVTGVPKEQVIEAARIYAGSKPATVLWSMGITQHSHGTENVLALINMVMLTGNIGKPASGVNPLRGQNNVQGACDMGCLPNVLSGYQSLGDSKVVEKFEAAWETKLNTQSGLTVMEMWEGISKGDVKALYIVGADPLLTVAGSEKVQDAIKKADFVVCQDLFLTETNRFAHVLLPAASFAEKDGVFVNTERRVQRVRKAIDPVGDSRPDWQIICELAKRMGAKGFDYKHPQEIMKEIASVTPIYAGISYDRLKDGGLQWPCPDSGHPGTPILHVGRFRSPQGKGRFSPLEYRPSRESADGEYPFLLTTDRSLFHFHTVLSQKVEGLNRLLNQCFLEISPEDAAKLGIADKELVQVISRRGQVKVTAKVSPACPQGVVAMNFHFSEIPTNLITSHALDPIAKTPETKVCAVQVRKLE